MQKIVTFLSFDNQAEEAVKFYVSIFKNSKIEAVSHYGNAGPGPEGSVMAVNFKLEDQDFIALNCGPMFKFTPAISLLVECVDQEDVDRYWAQLSAVPDAEGCGWLRDKFGVTWQIVPAIVSKLTQDTHPARANAVNQALGQMKKIDIQTLQEAYDRAQ
jgi:predicted 3-demethylubiquinone-9 3-methyltransferase (glyoxalase superfamily)